MNTLKIARHYHESDLAIIPLYLNGSKATKLYWRPRGESRHRPQAERYGWNEIERYFTLDQSGIGILCGECSGNLEVLDFDDPLLFPEWVQSPGLRRAIASLPLIATPSGGRHIYYRCEAVEPNQVLARATDGSIRIETRGQGGMVVAPGSPVEVHKDKKPYRLLSGNPFSIPFLTIAERASLLQTARQFNQYVKPEIIKKHKQAYRTGALGERASDLIEQWEWEEILGPKGWEIDRERAGITYWRKPGSERGNHHATTGYGNIDVFYCFSTDALPFEAGQSYNRFAVFAYLYHGGDFTQAAKAIRQNKTTARIGHNLTESRYEKREEEG